MITKHCSSYTLICCCFLAMLPISVMVAFVWKPSNTTQIGQPDGDKQQILNKMMFSSQQKKNMNSKLPYRHDITMDASRTRRTNLRDLNDAWTSVRSNSEIPLSCSICGHLGVPPIADATCSGMEDYASRTCYVLPDWETNCCDQSGLPPPHECEQQIRSEIFESYNFGIPPANVDTRLVDVDTFTTFYYLSSLDVKSSSLEAHLAFEMVWKDPRLAWDVTSDKCVTSIEVRASHVAEDTDIWTPGLDLLNKSKGLQDFPVAPATVFYDGTILWQRSGFVTAMCTFVGLTRMPFDELGCQMHFGSVQKRVRYNFMSEEGEGGEVFRGFKVGDYSQSYTEHKIIKDKSACEYYNGDVHNARFHIDVFFERSSRYYVLFFIFPSILFVILSFGQFFLDIDSGERLSYGVTVVLIMVTQSVVVSSFLPICQEMLWINAMNFVSMVFAIVSLCVTLFGFILKKIGNKPCVTEKTQAKRELEAGGNDAGEIEHLVPSAKGEDDDKNSVGPDEGIESKTNEKNLSLASEDQMPDNSGCRKMDMRASIMKVLSEMDAVTVTNRFFLFFLLGSFLVFLIIIFTMKDNLFMDEKNADGGYKSWVY